MSYSAIASDLVFRSASEAKWEQPPHTSISGTHNDIFYYEKPWNSLCFYRGNFPGNYIKLDVRARLKEWYPDEFPNMGTVGNAVKDILKKLHINSAITEEDRGWESSDFWACLEAVYISPEEYTNSIIAKVHSQLRRLP